MKYYYLLIILVKLAVAAIEKKRSNSAYLCYLMKQILLDSA